MIMRYVKKWCNWEGKEYALTIGKTYQCLPKDGGYETLLVFDDNHQWVVCHIGPFEPLTPDPLITWEE